MSQQIKIAIDGNEANLLNRVGSNVFAYETISALHRLLSRNYSVSVTVLLNRPPISSLPRARKHWKYLVFGPNTMWTQWALPIHLFLHHDRYDVFFTPGHYAPRISRVPYVSSVMDLAFLHHPQQFKQSDLLQLTNWTRYSVKNAQKVITISEHAKLDVVKNYSIPEEDVTVASPAAIPPSDIASPKQALRVMKRFGITDPYFIHVGTIQPRKNLIRLVESFERTSRKIQSHQVRKKGRRSSKKLPTRIQLVLVGKVGWLAQPILKRIKSSPVSKNIILTDYIPNKTKDTLIKYSEGMVQVGLYEGFGIPALEALHLNTIPIVSDITSLPEVVGPAGLHVNPLDVENISNAMYHLLVISAREKAQLKKAARKQIRKFSWEDSAATILRVLLEVAQNKP